MAELDMNAAPDNDDMLIKALCKELHLSYTQFPIIWAEKFQWQRRLWNNVDVLGFAQRLCKDASNLILSDRPVIRTNSEYLNYIIDREIKQRLNFDGVLAKNLQHMMGLGDMVMSTYTDPIDGRPAINYIPGNNVIPISYNNHDVSELCWFQKNKVKDKIYVTCVIESLKGRKTLLYQYDAGILRMINFGQPIWFRILGNVKPEILFHDDENKLPIKRFAWISTGLNCPRWIDTPFHNALISKTIYLDALKKDWDRLEDEMELSGKAVFVNPEMIRKTATATDENGMPIEMKKANIRSGLFQAVDIADDKVTEWVPAVRIAEFTQKIQFDLQMLTETAGLGPDFYKLDYPKIEMTATQSLLSHKEAYNTINAIKANLETAIKTIVFALLMDFYREGLIPDEEMKVLTDPSVIEVDFDDGVFVNKDARTDLGIRLMNSSNTIPGMRNIDQKTLLVDYCGYSKQRADYIIQKCTEEFEKATLLTAYLAANQLK